MRQIRTFNLANSVVKELNLKVRRGHRSKFVENAIDEKLQGKAEFDLWDFKISELTSHLEMFRYSSLSKLEIEFLRELTDKMRAKGE